MQYHPVVWDQVTCRCTHRTFYTTATLPTMVAVSKADGYPYGYGWEGGVFVFTTYYRPWGQRPR